MIAYVTRLPVTHLGDQVGLVVLDLSAGLELDLGLGAARLLWEERGDI